MPRASNQVENVANYYGFEDRRVEDRPVVDLCETCWDEWEATSQDSDFEVDHPPYEDQFPPYSCFDCGLNLTKRDN